MPVTLDQGQIGQLVSTSGIIVRISQPTILKTVQRMNCKKCKHVTFIKVSVLVNVSNIHFVTFVS